MPRRTALDVQRQTLRYFWDFAHPTSGLARERSNVLDDYGHEVVTTGGSGFGVMAIIVGTERNWISRQDAVTRLLKMVRFLQKADSYHGILPTSWRPRTCSRGCCAHASISTVRTSERKNCGAGSAPRWASVCSADARARAHQKGVASIRTLLWEGGWLGLRTPA